METLTDETTGQAASTYRYTAYGNADKTGTTGEDAITGDPIADAEVVNPYRFNGKRFDAATGTYDMGFREYDPGLNRFLTRDMYNGALADMRLGADPWTVNRYAFAGGNPTTMVEVDGHEPRPWHNPDYDPSMCADSNSLECHPTEDPRGVLATYAGNPESAAATPDIDTDSDGWVSPYEAKQAGVLLWPRKTEEQMSRQLGAIVNAAYELTIGDAVNCIFGDHDALSCAAAIPILKGAKLLKLGDEAADGVKTGARACRAGPNSFSGDTAVLMADGSSKPIAKVKVGDKVLATDPETGRAAGRDGQACFRPPRHRHRPAC